LRWMLDRKGGGLALIPTDSGLMENSVATGAIRLQPRYMNCSRSSKNS
jgi:hypothetical protein